jgi:hypothetical protein
MQENLKKPFVYTEHTLYLKGENIADREKQFLSKFGLTK